MSTAPDRRGGHLTRVPPNDPTLEGYLLGAALVGSAWSREAVAIVAQEGPRLYYPTSGAHAIVAESIAALAAEDAPIDVGTVAAHLRQRGQLDAAGGHGKLHDLAASVPAVSNAARYAETLRDFAARRRQLGLAGELVDTIYRGGETAGLVAELHAESQAAALVEASSWQPVNLALILAGEGELVRPAHLLRADGVPLLYPGKIHALNAESESGKSWLALFGAVERMRAGEHVLYVDFEAAAVDVVERLLALGADPDALLERFHYVRPEDPVDATARLHIAGILRAWPISYAVIDGVGEALAITNLDENKAPDVLRFFVLLPRAIAASGASVVMIDHLVKDKERQGSDARGSGAKRAGIDASYKLEVVRPFARGQAGHAKVLVTKDRHGWVRRAATGRTVADLHLSSSGEGEVVRLDLRPPEGSAGEPFRPTILMERVSASVAADNAAGVEPTQADVVRSVHGKRPATLEAIRLLVLEGYIEAVSHGRSITYRSARRFSAGGPHEEEDF